MDLTHVHLWATAASTQRKAMVETWEQGVFWRLIAGEPGVELMAGVRPGLGGLECLTV